MTIIYLVMAWTAGLLLASVVNLRCELWSLSALVTLIDAVPFRTTSLTHIIAISGFILTIMATIVLRGSGPLLA